jgi:fatty acid desaturase (delta-4 desaturase)
LLTGTLLGLAGAWIGLTVQHCGNHGAMSTKTWVNKALGLCDDLIGGSSLMWRYHHQVSGKTTVQQQRCGSVLIKNKTNKLN